MPAFRRVLVGYDGSEPACDALALARRLVDPDDGELVVARIDPMRSFRLPHGHRPAPAADVLERAIDQVDDGVRVRAVERAAASAARGLTELAEAEGADLLVIGAHHQGPDGRASPGPTSSRLLQGAPCAVAIAPLGDREADRFHHVGVAFDGSPEANAALEAAYALAARDGAAVSLYLAVGNTKTAYAGAEVDAVLQAERAHGQELLDRAADAAPAGVNPRTVLLHGEPGAEIAQETDGIVDILFAGSRAYGPFHRVLAGSVSEALLRAATEPVIILPRAGVAVERMPTT
jgi:nucleotide-binding universal stress UspA family protein